MSTVLSLLPMTCRNSNTARMRALWPTTIGSVAEVMAVSEEAQRLELRELVTERGFNPEMERHVRARAAGAHAGEPDVRRILVDGDELDVTAIGLQEGSDAFEHRLNPLSRNHQCLPLPEGQRVCQESGAGIAAIWPAVRCSGFDGQGLSRGTAKNPAGRRSE